jgi:hypothetical protein
MVIMADAGDVVAQQWCLDRMTIGRIRRISRRRAVAHMRQET